MRPAGWLIHHSDRGRQYTCLAFGLGRPRHDDALAESFFAGLESQLIDRTSWATLAEARAAVFD